MAQLKLILRARARETARWAREHLYTLLVLGPLVLVMTYFGVGRMVRENADWQLSPAFSASLAIAGAACLIALSLSRASMEIYHLRTPETVFDTLPVSVRTHLYAALAARAARTTVLGVAALVARTFFEGGGWLDVALWPSLLLLVAVVALCEVLTALVWIHRGHVRSRAATLGGLAGFILGAGTGGLLLLSIVRPASFTAGARAWLIAAALTAAALLFLAASYWHERWRTLDIEYAKRLQAKRSRTLFGAQWFTRLVLRLVETRAAAASLVRDLQLTFRAFSSAVYVASGVGVLWVLMLVAAFTTGLVPQADVPGEWFQTTWMPPVMAVKFACVFVVASLASMLPVLVAHQIPHLWLERSIGTSGAGLWQAKLWYARLVTCPAPLVVWTAGALASGMSATGGGGVPAYYVLPLLGECVWLWWLVSTTFGALAYEVPEQPGLAIILMVCAGLAVGFVASMLWPIGLALYAFALSPMSIRALMRAHRHLAGEEI